jgi:hypothetical protein
MKIYTLLVPLGLVFLVACPQASQPMTASDAKTLKTVLPLALNGFANSVRSGGSSAAGTASEALKPFGLQPKAVTGTCGSSAAITDVDGDKIPSSFSYTYDCTVTVGAGFTFKAKGLVKSSDSNDNDGNSGYTTEGNLRYDFIFTNTQTQETSGFAFVVQWNATATIATSGGYTISTDQRLTFQPDTDKSQFGYQLTATYLPDSDGNNLKFDAGKLNIVGSANFSNAQGKFSVLNLNVTNLHFGGLCPRAVDSGIIRLEDSSNLNGGKNNLLELTATGCDVWSATYNGSTSF